MRVGAWCGENPFVEESPVCGPKSSGPVCKTKLFLESFKLQGSWSPLSWLFQLQAAPPRAAQLLGRIQRLLEPLAQKPLRSSCQWLGSNRFIIASRQLRHHSIGSGQIRSFHSAPSAASVQRGTEIGWAPEVLGEDEGPRMQCKRRRVSRATLPGCVVTVTVRGVVQADLDSQECPRGIARGTPTNSKFGISGIRKHLRHLFIVQVEEAQPLGFTWAQQALTDSL